MNMLQTAQPATSVWNSSCMAHFHAECPTRELFDQIVDKWSVMVLAVLEHAPQRFNAIKRSLEGVSQKSLTQTLRRLERNGLVHRRVLATSPVAVEYTLSDLGCTLLPAFRTLYYWVKSSIPAVEAARAAFDRAAAE